MCSVYKNSVFCENFPTLYEFYNAILRSYDKQLFLFRNCQRGKYVAINIENMTQTYDFDVYFLKI